jgi:methylmalonyl-CoA epimerase
VEQTEREIGAFTSAPILRTVAIDGAGVPALADELQSRGRRAADQNAAVNTLLPVAGTCEIDHLGIAVRSLDEALPFYTAQLGMAVASRETVEHEMVRLAMLPAGEARIELLEPLSADSTIARFLDKRGPGLHHVALRVPDLEAVIARLEKAGVRLLGAPQRGAGGHTYVFVHPAWTGGVLWEIIQA